MEEPQINLEKFDIKKIKSDSIIVLVAKRNSGKTILVKDILYNHYKLPCAIVISPTESSNKTYGHFIPDSFIFDEYNEGKDNITIIKSITTPTSPFSKMLIQNNQIIDEIGTYENLKITSSEDLSKFDLLNWWKINEYVYPTLSKIAKDFLSIQSTSVSSEQLFSESKLVITDRRNRLNEDTIQYLMCLRSWNELFDKK